MDRLDAAFLARLTTAPRDERRAAVAASRPLPATTRIALRIAPEVVPRGTPQAVTDAGVAALIGGIGDDRPAPSPEPVAEIDRSGPWEQIAVRLAETGYRVVGLAGAGTATGIDALAARIAALLRARGRRVEQRAGPVLSQLADDGGAESDVVLVVGGDWFPAGPVNARRLIGHACGCDAVVLLRPEHRPPCPAHAAALDALGVPLLATVDAADLGDRGVTEAHA